jgi:lipopolysaccharide/colanic/teichoic acid biosynthesis glycosyltransferase
MEASTLAQDRAPLMRARESNSGAEVATPSLEGGVAAYSVEAGGTDDVSGNLDVGSIAFPILKRMIDLLVAAVLLASCAPISLVVAALIKLSDGGPVIFWQKRAGRHGREFWFPKSRSMQVGAEHMQDVLLNQMDDGNSITFKMRKDPRVTRVGRIIRTLSIDELPQLWNVLKGDMSMVGPRPPLPGEVARYTQWVRQRLAVKPGLTGLWQVQGRSTVGFAGQVALDLEYIRNRSLRLDLKVLLLTIPAVLSCEGAW